MFFFKQPVLLWLFKKNEKSSSIIRSNINIWLNITYWGHRQIHTILTKIIVFLFPCFRRALAFWWLKDMTRTWEIHFLVYLQLSCITTGKWLIFLRPSMAMSHVQNGSTCLSVKLVAHVWCSEAPMNPLRSGFIWITIFVIPVKYL